MNYFGKIMNNLLIIPDYKYELNSWEAKRSYFKGFTERAKAEGWNLIDINNFSPADDLDCIFVSNYAQYFDKIHNIKIHDLLIKSNIPKILSIFETPSRRPDLWRSTYWFDVCVSFNRNPKKYCHCKHIENPYPYNFGENETTFKDWNSRDTLVWVATNNWFLGFDSLSQLRLRDFNYFISHLDENGGIYGAGWDERKTELSGPLPIFGELQRYKNKKIFNEIINYFFGPAENKNSVISNYKFCFSYENTNNFPGYITEKVFDAWMSGCVPIYRGEHKFEKDYRGLLISPRILGLKKSVEKMYELDAEKAYKLHCKFRSLLTAGKFKEFSHELFQKNILEVATSLV